MCDERLVKISLLPREINEEEINFTFNRKLVSIWHSTAAERNYCLGNRIFYVSGESKKSIQHWPRKRADDYNFTFCVWGNEMGKQCWDKTFFCRHAVKISNQANKIHDISARGLNLDFAKLILANWSCSLLSRFSFSQLTTYLIGDPLQLIHYSAHLDKVFYQLLLHAK